MTPHKYDHILIHRNPFNHKPQSITYIDPKFIQLRIYYKCEEASSLRRKNDQSIKWHIDPLRDPQGVL